MDLSYLRRVGVDIVDQKAAATVLSRGAKSSAVPPPPPSPAGGRELARMMAPCGCFGSDLMGKGFCKETYTRGKHPPWLRPNAGHDAKLQVANSLTGEKEPFVPLNGKKVLWYTCGPTVYDVSHMGHARAYLTFDILRRIMVNYFGYDVQYQVNITDVDDKIILRSRQNKLFEDFSKEAAKMKPAELKRAAEDALEFARVKLEKKAPEKPKEGATEKEKQEYVTNQQEHELKLGQHAELVVRVGTAIASGKADDVLAATREAFMGKLDKERGHTLTDHSIFDAHARRYEDEFFEDMDNLGILRPDTVTRISTYMDGRVQRFIERLEELGVAYSSKGSVYFDIIEFEKMGYHYRKLSPATSASAKEMEEGEGALAAENAEKKNPNDFALWKASKAGEPAWESKWGPGRPGWHIECSVMATDINGEYLDIHAGGEDLKFPHHDNEMAQSEAYLQRSQWTNYFWHAGHLHIEGLKMSKSLKNFITIRQALEMHTPRQLRLMFLMQAWDKGMNYSDQAIEMAKAEEKKFKQFFGSLEFWARQPEGAAKPELAAKLEAATAACRETVDLALKDSFCTPRAVEALSKLVPECQPLLDARVPLAPVHAAAKLIADTFAIFGVEGLVGEPTSGRKEDWFAVVDAFADLRQQVRELMRQKAEASQVLEAVQKSPAPATWAGTACLKDCAAAYGKFQEDLRALATQKAAAGEFLKRCDTARDVDFVHLGIRLQDRANEGYLWMFDTRKAMEAEQRETEEKAREAAVQKIKNKLAVKEKELTIAEKAAVEPANLFRNGGYAGLYSAFDAEGIPTKQASGEEVSAKKKKDLAKEFAKQQKDHEKLQKQAAAAGGVDKFLAKLRQEVASMKAELGPDHGN